MLIQEQVLFEKDGIIAINKPAGILSQSDQSSDDSIHSLVEKSKGRELHLLNRLDRPVSGIIALAEKGTLVDWSKTVKKYIAITSKADIKEATLSHYIKRNGQQKKAHISENSMAGYKACKLSYKVLQELDHVEVVEITIATGKFHQIRAQLAHIGRNIRGDVKYGARRGNKDRSIDLHAFHLHLPDQQQTIIAPALRDTPLWKMINEDIIGG